MLEVLAALSKALRDLTRSDLDARDEHVFELEDRVRALTGHAHPSRA